MHRHQLIVDGGRLVDEWRVIVLGHRPAQEGAQRRPPLADVVLEQAVGGHEGAYMRVVRLEARLAIAREVVAVERLVQLLEHGPVPAVGHAQERGQEADGGPEDAGVDDFQGVGDGSE